MFTDTSKEKKPVHITMKPIHSSPRSDCKSIYEKRYIIYFWMKFNENTYFYSFTRREFFLVVSKKKKLISLTSVIVYLGYSSMCVNRG